MDFKQSMKPGVVLSEKSNLTVTIVVFILGLVIGGLLAGLYFRGKVNEAKSDCASAQSATGKAKQGETTAPGIPKALVPNEIYNVSGQISKIDGNTLAVKSFSFGEEKLYTVKVVDGTKIVKREILASPPEAEEGKPVSPFKETDAKLSDLQENDNINVLASENIKDKTEFEAKTIYIEIQNAPPVPAPPMPSADNNLKVPEAPAAPPVPATVPEAPPAPSTTTPN